MPAAALRLDGMVRCSCSTAFAPTGGVTGTLTRRRANGAPSASRNAFEARGCAASASARRAQIGRLMLVAGIGRHDAFDRRVLRKLQGLELEHLLSA